MIKQGSTAQSDIAKLLTKHLSIKGRVLYMIPGGSACKVAIDALKQVNNEQQQNIIVTLTDERYGQVGHEHSNWNLIQKYTDEIAAMFLPVLKDGTLQQTSESWSSQLLQIINEKTPIVAVFGIGLDQHIAGLKPDFDYGTAYNDLVVGYKANDFTRLSISPSFFKLIDEAVIYTVGQQKHTVIQALDTLNAQPNAPMLLASHAKNLHLYYTD